MTTPTAARRKCTAKLKRGEYKRIPADSSRVAVGYYIACPQCGTVNPLTTKQIESSGIDVVEVKDEEGESVLESMQGGACLRCGREIEIVEGRFV